MNPSKFSMSRSYFMYIWIKNLNTVYETIKNAKLTISLELFFKLSLEPRGIISCRE